MLKLVVAIVFPLSLVSFVSSDRLRDLGDACCPFQQIDGLKYRHVKSMATAIDDQCQTGCVYEDITKPGSRYCFNETIGTEGSCWEDYQGFEMINRNNNPMTYWTLSVGSIRHGPGSVTIGETQSKKMVASLKQRTQSYNKVQNSFSASASASGSAGGAFAEVSFEASVSAESNFEHWTDDTSESTQETEEAMVTNVVVTVNLEKNDLLLTAYEMKLYVYEFFGTRYHMILATGRTMSGVFDNSSLENMYLDDSFSGIGKLYNLYNIRSVKEMAEMITPKKLSTKFQVVSLAGKGNLRVNNRKIPDTPSERYHTAAGFVHDTLMVCGGKNESVNATSGCFKIGQTGTWEESLSMIVARYGHTINKVDDKLVAIGGGSNESTPLDSTEIYENGMWIPGHYISPARFFHCTVKLSKYELILIGGHDGSSEMDLVEKFNILTGESMVLPSLTRATEKQACAIREENGQLRVYVAGGYTSTRESKVSYLVIYNSGEYSNWTDQFDLLKSVLYGFLYLGYGNLRVYDNYGQPGTFYVFNSIDNQWMTQTGKTGVNNKWGVQIAIPGSFREDQ